MIIDSPVVSGSLTSSGPFTEVGNVTISGSLTVTGGVIMSGSIASASQATSASYANSASYSLSGSYAATASYAINSTAAANATSASYAATASYANAFTVGGTITAQTLVVQTITSSVEYSSGSNVFGNSVSNTHQFTGSMSVSGSMNVNANSLVVNTNGTVSVGNTNSTYNLDVTGTFRATGAATFSSSVTSTYNVVNSGASDATFLAQTTGLYSYLTLQKDNAVSTIKRWDVMYRGDTYFGNTSNALIFLGEHANSAGTIDGYYMPLALQPNGNVIMCAGSNVLGNGNVGIGTSSPQVKLDLQNGNAGFYNNTASSGGAQLYLGDMNFAGGAYATSAPGIGAAYNSGQGVAGDLAFYVYASVASSRNEAMRIKGGTGNVLIGTTTDNGLAKIQVAGNVYSSTGFYGTGATFTISSLNSSVIVKNTAFSGIITIRDNSNGGSAVWLADPNQGFIQIANNMPGTFSMIYSGGNTYIQKNSGGVPVNYSVAFYGNNTN